jgi:hypothetical protein
MQMVRKPLQDQLTEQFADSSRGKSAHRAGIDLSGHAQGHTCKKLEFACISGWI